MLSNKYSEFKLKNEIKILIMRNASGSHSIILTLLPDHWPCCWALPPTPADFSWSGVGHTVRRTDSVPKDPFYLPSPLTLSPKPLSVPGVRQPWRTSPTQMQATPVRRTGAGHISQKDRCRPQASELEIPPAVPRDK